MRKIVLKYLIGLKKLKEKFGNFEIKNNDGVYGGKTLDEEIKKARYKLRLLTLA